MLRRIAVVCFVLGFVLHGRAQEQEVYINGSDTLHYTYTPLPGQEEEPQAEKRPPFLRRVVKYFEGSTTDRTFEKKIDFTFAGGGRATRRIRASASGCWPRASTASTARTR